MRRRFTILSILTLVLALGGVYAAYAWTPVPVAEDPLVRMPGTQPGQTTLRPPAAV